MKKILSILIMSTAILNEISAITAIKPNNNEILTNFIKNETEYAKLIQKQYNLLLLTIKVIVLWVLNMN